MLDSDLKLAQRPGTEQLLRAYLLPAAGGKDTVTALFMAPMYCPRCEATIPAFKSWLKWARPSERFIIVADYYDAYAAGNYVRSQQFGEDALLLDTNGEFNRIFSTTTGTLTGIFIGRFDVRHGRMLTGGQLSFINPQFFKDFLAVRVPLPFHDYGERPAAHRQTAVSDASLCKSLHFSSPFFLPGGSSLSFIRNHAILKDNRLILNDQLCNTGFLWKQNENGLFELEHVLAIDSARRDTFITLPAREYARQKSAFRYMVLATIFSGPDEVCMSCSLPRVFMERKDACAFYNSATFFRYRLKSYRALPLSSLPFIDAHKPAPDLINFHFNIYPLNEKRVVMMCERFYPDDEKEMKANPEKDPYNEAFYKKPCPYGSVMDKATGKITGYFGELEPVLKRSRTNYWFVNLVADALDKDFIYGNGYTGTLYLTDAQTPEKTLRRYQVFKLDEKAMPSVDTSLFYKLEYVQPYYRFFNKRIVLVTLDKDFINCLIHTAKSTDENINDGRYSFVRLSRKSGEIVESYPLTFLVEDGVLLGYGLSGGHGKGIPFYIAKAGSKSIIRFVSE